jgi:uncharacterized SAM-binding protein YcdF (DUF218 family)
MLLIKNSVSVLTAPLVIVMLIATAAWMCRFRGRIRTSWALLVCAAVVLYLSSIPLVGYALLRPLEAAFPPLTGEQPPAVGYVVVLGSGYAPYDAIPVTAALDEDGLVRVVEAVRLVRSLSGSRLVVSGGARQGSVPVAEGYARLARELGIGRQSIILSDQPIDTRAEAGEVWRLLGSAPFLLVTSAYHMPRAMLVMKQAGAKPIAAPTGQRAFGPVTWRSLLPGSAGLGDTERAIHEYLGLVGIAIGLD